MTKRGTNGQYEGGCTNCRDLDKRVKAIEQYFEQVKYKEFTSYNEHMSASQVVLCWIAKFGTARIDTMYGVVGHVFTRAALKGALYNLNRVKIVRRINQGEYVLNA